jgi:hypothetical protein
MSNKNNKEILEILMGQQNDYTQKMMENIILKIVLQKIIISSDEENLNFAINDTFDEIQKAYAEKGKIFDENHWESIFDKLFERIE